MPTPTKEQLEQLAEEAHIPGMSVASADASGSITSTPVGHVWKKCTLLLMTYDLDVIPDEDATKRQPNKIYLKNTADGLQYEIIGPDGKLQQNKIPLTDLPEGFPKEVSDIIRSKETCLPILLAHIPAAQQALSLVSPPDSQHLNDLPLKTNTAYLRHNNQLYFVDKQKKECTLITEDPDQLREFDEKMRCASSKPGEERELGAEELALITSITGHTRGETPIPIQDDTVFGAASLSKPVFAYLVLKLIELNKNNPEGLGKFTLPPGVEKFDLDTPLSKILPPGDRYRAAHGEPYALTTRLSLSHQSGLPIGTPEKPIPFDFEPGQGFAYSGYPFLYLQDVIEHLTGSTLEELAQEFIFKPLHMDHSSFLQPDESVTASRSDTPQPPATETCAANSLFTTSRDYARFISAWMHDPELNYAFNSQVSMTEDRWMAKNGEAHKKLPEPFLEGLGWGLGMAVEVEQTRDGQVSKKASHSGDMNEWRAFVVMDLKRKTGTVFFANSYNGHALVRAIMGSSDGVEFFFSRFPFASTPSELVPGAHGVAAPPLPPPVPSNSTGIMLTNLGGASSSPSPRPAPTTRQGIEETEEEMDVSKEEPSSSAAEENEASTNSTYKTPTPFSKEPKPPGSR